MPYTIQSGQLSGLELVTSNMEAIEDTFYKVLYTETSWREKVPDGSIITNIPEGARSSSYPVKDVTGRAAFREQFSGDIPVIGRSISKPESIPIYTALAAAVLDDDQARQFQYAYGTAMEDDFPEDLAFACDKCVEGNFFFGNAQLGYKPWINYPGVTVIGAGSGPWSGIEGDAIVKDVNDAISAVWSDSKEVFVPGAVWLPTDQYGIIVTRRMPDIKETVYKYLVESNVYTARTGQPLTIKSCPYLKGAGVASADRMLVETHLPRYHKIPFPIPFRLRPPFQIEYGVKIISEVRFGSYHNRQPSSMIYMDGI